MGWGWNLKTMGGGGKGGVGKRSSKVREVLNQVRKPDAQWASGGRNGMGD